MGIPQVDVETLTSVPTWEMSTLPDLEIYKSDLPFSGLLEHGSPLVEMSTINKLAAGFPDVRKNDISFGLIAAYIARMSENGEAVFPLQDNRTPLSHGAYIPISIVLHPEESFGMFLSRALLARTMMNSNKDSHWEHTKEQSVSVAVSLGQRTKPLKNSDIWLNCTDRGHIDWRCNNAISNEAMAVISERITALAEGIAADMAKPLSRQPLMSERERHVVVHEWNSTNKEYSYDGGLVAQMERQAELNPNQTALIYKDEEMSFGEFNARVNKLARILRDKGVSTDKFVCLCLDRSFELVIAIWATMKAGGAYVPLNTQDPVGRINEIVSDCKPKVVLGQAHLAEQLEEVDAEVLMLPDGGDMGDKLSGENLGDDIAANSLAYMIYTSGSTGKPKGVVVEHGAIHNRVVWMHEEYGLSPEDRVLQKTPYTFDVSVWEFLWSFSVGSTLVIAEPDGHLAIGYLYHLINDHRVTHLHFVPSVLRLFMMAPALDKLAIKKLFCSGEALGFDIVQQFYSKAGDQAEVHNLYGPTEAAVDVSYYHCPREPENNFIPIGRPVSNTSLLILDELNQPVPIGVPGELHIGGVQLARGYWNREELTAERFVENPVADAQHDRLYKTGDLAKFMPDGEIVYMGRNDFQVKINGVRIELGEIETMIRTHENVKDVVVLAEEQAGNKILLSYVVASDPSEELGDELKQRVVDQCPVFYVPKHIHFIENMPLTVSGKIDRKLLATLPKLA